MSVTLVIRLLTLTVTDIVFVSFDQSRNVHVSQHTAFEWVKGRLSDDFPISSRSSLD